MDCGMVQSFSEVLHFRFVSHKVEGYPCFSIKQDFKQDIYFIFSKVFSNFELLYSFQSQKLTFF